MLAGLSALFVGSLLASTLVPGGVEVLLFYMYRSGEYSVVALLVVSTIGNTLGGVITYWMGDILRRGLSRVSWYAKTAQLFKLNASSLVRVEKWGVPVLFFSWMPVIGDPLCLAAGYLRLSFWPSALMIFIGKFVRYTVLLWIFAQPWASIPD